MQWYWKAAKQGNADAEQAVGRMYEKGEGVQQDSAEAKRWYDKAAGQKKSEAAPAPDAAPAAK